METSALFEINNLSRKEEKSQSIDMIEDGINHQTDVGEFLQMNLSAELKYFWSLQNPLNQTVTCQARFTRP